MVQAIPLPPTKLRGQIAYAQHGDLWVLNPDTRQKRLLFRGQDYRADFSEADFSQDRTKIVYSRVSAKKPMAGENPGWAIYVMDWAGKNAHAVIEYPQYNGLSKPRFSYDGKRIVYLQTFSPWGGAEPFTTLSIVDINEPKLALVTREISTGTPLSAFWSFDGTEILYLSQSGSPAYPEPITKPTVEVTKVSKAGQTVLPNSDSQPPTFNGDWSRFFLPNISHNRKKFAHIIESHGSRELIISPANSAATGVTLASSISGLFPGENEYEDISRVALNSNDTRAVVAGAAVQVDTTGYARNSNLSYDWNKARDIWVFDLMGKKPPRLLVTKAKLLAWL